MAREAVIGRYRRLYARLLRAYPRAHRERFGEEMEQTFADRLRDYEKGKSVFVSALWMFVETSVSIMRENMTHTVRQHKSILRVALMSAILLLIPAVAMLVTDEIAWGVGDFVFAGVVLFGAGLTYELVARRANRTSYRAAAGVAVMTALLLVWMNLAVGLIASEDENANLMYVGVLAVLVVGAFLARLRPKGMALALFGAAAAQMLVAVIVLSTGLLQDPGNSVLGVLGVNGVFAALFATSALLFQRAHAMNSA